MLTVAPAAHCTTRKGHKMAGLRCHENTPTLRDFTQRVLPKLLPMSWYAQIPKG